VVAAGAEVALVAEASAVAAMVGVEAVGVLAALAAAISAAAEPEATGNQGSRRRFVVM